MLKQHFKHWFLNWFLIGGKLGKYQHPEKVKQKQSGYDNCAKSSPMKRPRYVRLIKVKLESRGGGQSLSRLRYFKSCNLQKYRLDILSLTPYERTRCSFIFACVVMAGLSRGGFQCVMKRTLFSFVLLLFNYSCPHCPSPLLSPFLPTAHLPPSTLPTLSLSMGPSYMGYP